MQPDPREIRRRARIVAAAKSAMARARGLTAGTRAASDNSLDMTVMRLRESIRRRCEVCSGRVEVGGTCTCQLRCPADRVCQAQPELADDELSIP